MIDNCSFHRSEHTKETIEKLKIRVLYSGPYSFDLSPAERFFAIVKNGGIQLKKYSK